MSLDQVKQIIEVAIHDMEIGDRFRKDSGDIAELAGSIEDAGLLQPIGVTSGKELVLGEHRL